MKGMWQVGEAVFAECKKRFALWRLFWEKSQAPLFSCCFACHRFCRTFSSPEVCWLPAGPLREQNSCRKRIDIRPLLNLTLSFFGMSVGILKNKSGTKVKKSRKVENVLASYQQFCSFVRGGRRILIGIRNEKLCVQFHTSE